ncbi:hypothetical protein LB505_002012 [Fusarium chuoi]|nr:hypothetical protein LB505_002012 [Fusarium chuoi]
MQWFHGWLRQWLAPLTQERPTGNRSRQSTASQRQNSTSTSSTQRNKGTSRPRRLPKRKRANEDEDEGNEESSKSQRIDENTCIVGIPCPSTSVGAVAWISRPPTPWKRTFSNSGHALPASAPRMD